MVAGPEIAPEIVPDAGAPAEVAADLLVPELSVWSASTQRRGFYVIFGLTTLAMGVLLHPFIFTLLFAAATAVVVSPLVTRIKNVFGVTRTTSTVFAMILVLLGVALPVVVLSAVLAGDVSAFSSAAGAWLEGLVLPPELEELRQRLRGPAPLADLTRSASEDVTRLPGLAPFVGSVVGLVTNVALDLCVYVLVTFTLLAEGPRVLRASLLLLPVDPLHAARLFQAFREIANNFVVGTVATAVLQGVVAGVGWWLLGLPHGLLFAVGIALSSLVPVLGTVVVWGPAALAVWMAFGGWSAGAVVLWNVVFTGTVDNIAKPLFLRGKSELNAVPLFLSIFGGILWFGMPGLLFGPLVVAFFAACYQIHCEVYLGVKTTPAARRGSSRKLLARLFRKDRQLDVEVL